LPALLREEGRRFWDVALLLQDAILFAQPGELLTRRRWQPRLAMASIGARLAHQLRERGRRQIQLACHRADRLPFVSYQPNCRRSERLRELSSRSSSRVP
jgi:hypothetical protein